MKNWYSSNCSSHAVVADQDTGKTIAIVFEKSDSDLLAAAPYLLEALDLLLDCADMDYLDEETKPIINKAREAISKAKGE